MKLKKIASLMLAGIMAVSMLAGCKTADNGNGGASSSEPTTSSSVTESVLSKTSEALRNKLTVNSDTKLDEAIAYTAQNNSYGNYVENLTVLMDDGVFVIDAEKIMTGGDIQAYTANPGDWDFSASKVSKDATYWTMYAVTRTKSDEWIIDAVADKLDDLVDQFDDADFEYSVRVAMADCKANENAAGSHVGDTVIVGVAITCDNLKDNH